jgi:hypothetical protein
MHVPTMTDLAMSNAKIAAFMNAIDLLRQARCSERHVALVEMLLAAESDQKGKIVNAIGLADQSEMRESCK